MKTITKEMLPFIRKGDILLCIDGFNDGRKLLTGHKYRFQDYLMHGRDLYINVIPTEENKMLGDENWSFHRFMLLGKKVKQIEIV